MATVRNRKGSNKLQVRIMTPTGRKDITMPEGMSRRDALRAAIEMEREARMLGLGIAAPAKPATISEFLTSVQQDKAEAVSASTQSAHRSTVRRFIEHVGDVQVSQIDRDVCERYQRKRVAEGNRSTVRKEVSFLAEAFSVAVRRGLIRVNPWDEVKRPKDNPSKERFLNADEFGDLLAASPAHRKLRYAVLVYTGARRGEAAALTWGDIDFDAGRIRVPNSQKGGGSKRAYRWIPLVDPLRGHLGAPGRPDELILNGTVHNYNRDLAADTRNAGLEPGLRIHDLRHTCASWLAQGGAHVTTIRDWLGHSSITTTERYMHFAPDHLAGAAGILSGTQDGPELVSLRA